MRHNYRRRQTAAGSWCCGAQLQRTGRTGEHKCLLSYLESNPVPNWSMLAHCWRICMCSLFILWSPVNTETLFGELYSEKWNGNPKTQPSSTDTDYRPRRTFYKIWKICLRNVGYQNANGVLRDAVHSLARRSLFPKFRMISRAPVKVISLQPAAKGRPSLFRCSRNSPTLSRTACRSAVPNFNKSDNQHWKDRYSLKTLKQVRLLLRRFPRNYSKLRATALHGYLLYRVSPASVMKYGNYGNQFTSSVKSDCHWAHSHETRNCWHSAKNSTEFEENL
jgi:hypothetical protein